MQLVLASQSPYRAELLKKLNVEFETLPSNLDESEFKSQISDPVKLAQRLALAKAEKVFRLRPDAVVIGSDQIAFQDQEIFHQPKTFDKNLEQLKKMSGSWHSLVTAVHILGAEIDSSFFDLTHLKMWNLSDEEINTYIQNDRAFDCAGGYKLEAHGISLFEEIQSQDFTAIQGLPLLKLNRFLRQI